MTASARFKNIKSYQIIETSLTLFKHPILIWILLTFSYHFVLLLGEISIFVDLANSWERTFSQNLRKVRFDIYIICSTDCDNNKWSVQQKSERLKLLSPEVNIKITSIFYNEKQNVFLLLIFIMKIKMCFYFSRDFDFLLFRFLWQTFLNLQPWCKKYVEYSLKITHCKICIWLWT